MWGRLLCRRIPCDRLPIAGSTSRSSIELYGPAVFQLQAQVAGTSCKALGMGAGELVNLIRNLIVQMKS